MKVKEFRNQYRFLSNFWNGGYAIRMDGANYPTVENAFQAAKTLDLEARKEFQIQYSGSEMEYITPGTAKRLGRNLVLRSDWETVKLPIMECLLREKFRLEIPRQKLLETAGLILVEGNDWNDRFWGVDNRTGIGHNHLGKLLMKIRDEYLEQAKAPPENNVKTYSGCPDSAKAPRG